MLDNILQTQNITLPLWIIIVITLGSIVDICQFLWILKTVIANAKQRYYKQIYIKASAEVMEALKKASHQNQNHSDASKIR